eukprot:gene6820-30792_t
MCNRLACSWACLTSITPKGTYFQHHGAAYGADCQSLYRSCVGGMSHRSIPPSHGGGASSYYGRMNSSCPANLHLSAGVYVNHSFRPRRHRALPIAQQQSNTLPKDYARQATSQRLAPLQEQTAGTSNPLPQGLSKTEQEGHPLTVVPPSGTKSLNAKRIERLRISTGSTLLISVLEAGDIMTIKDSLAYFGRDRMVAGDLALNGRAGTAGTLMLLPLIHKCRALGCVYIFAKNDINSMLPRSSWSELSELMSRAVFTKLVGELRFHWYSCLSDDLPPDPDAVNGLMSLNNSGALLMGELRSHWDSCLSDDLPPDPDAVNGLMSPSNSGALPACISCEVLADL